VLFRGTPILEVEPPPSPFPRRSGELTCNVSGRVFPSARLWCRIGEGEAFLVSRSAPRSPEPTFTVEIDPDELSPGPNRISFTARGPLGRKQTVEVMVEHDDSAVSLPLTEDWSGYGSSAQGSEAGGLDVQDGQWQCVGGPDGWRVRPVPGTEEYDRILNVCGAFPGGRRVSTDMIFRRGVRPFGCGVLVLWGGHPDPQGGRPRSGWLYSIGWYMSIYGVGIEDSVRIGSSPRRDVLAYVSSNIEEGRRYRLVMEAVPERDSADVLRCWRQRLKWWPDDESEPEDWLETTDYGEAKLPDREYSVALMAHRCQVEFGPIRIERI
jgi:hypothetical protein